MGNRYFREDGDDMIVGGGSGYGGGYGNGGFGGIGAIIALVVVVAILWFLAREGRGCNDGCNNGGYPYPPAYPYPPVYPYGGGKDCCNPLDCRIPMTPDMSNCDLDRDILKTDADVWKAACEVKDTVKDGDQAILNKLCETETQNLRDKLAKEYAKNSAGESKAYTSELFNKLENMIWKMDNQNDKQVAGLAGMIKDLKCDIDHCFPKLPPQWIDSITPDTHHADCRHDDFPRRSKGYNDGCGCGCGCN